MEVLEFRYVNVYDKYNDEYNDGHAWSRVYEYQLVLDMIAEYTDNKDITIHNTSWGFEGIHIKFKENLEKIYPNAVNSDIKSSILPKTFVYDITKNDINLQNKYDVVINISTLEEVNADHMTIFNNLLSQVKDGGLLICTFDLPGLQLDRFEELFNKKLKTNNNNLTNSNSRLMNLKFSKLECGLMVIRK